MRRGFHKTQYPIYEYFNGTQWVEVVQQRLNPGIRVRFVDLYVNEKGVSLDYYKG